MQHSTASVVPALFRPVFPLLFEVENIQNHVSASVQQDNMPANDDVGALGRRWWQLPFQFFRTWLNFFLQSRGQRTTHYELSLEARRKLVPFGEARR